MKSPPSPLTSDVTFLFTDIEGSTAPWDRAPEAMTESPAEHDRGSNSIVRVEAAEAAAAEERVRSDELNQQVGGLRIEQGSTKSELDQARSEFTELVNEARAVLPKGHVKRIARLGIQ